MTRETEPSSLKVFKCYEKTSRLYFLEAAYDVSPDVRRRLGQAGVLDTKLFYEENGGLPFGIIGSIPDVMIYGLINELVKTKISITAKDLLDGITKREANFAAILAYEAALRKAASNLDSLIAYMQDFPVIEMPEEHPAIRPNRTIEYREIRIPLIREKTGLLSSSEYYEYRGRRYNADQVSELLQLLMSNERYRLAQPSAAPG